jgi:ATP-dependent protease HslVU (ClpYQ) peptidase subunit
MTTIAARKVGGGLVTMAWDSQATKGSTPVHGFVKVRRINRQFAVGIAGDLRYANLIHQASVKKIAKADLINPKFDVEAWVVRKLVPSWGRAIEKAKEEGTAQEPEGSALLVIRGRIFEVEWDFGVCDVGEYGAIGSGSPFALTALHLGRGARKAVDIASRLDVYTGGEIKEVTL